MQWDDRSHTLIIGERTGEFRVCCRSAPSGWSCFESSSAVSVTATEARSVDYKGSDSGRAAIDETRFDFAARV